MVIDFHTHIFPDTVCDRIVDKLSREGGIQHFTNASAHELSSSMKRACIDYSIDLPVTTRPDQVEEINTRMIEQRDLLLSIGIIPFGGIHPDFADYRSEITRLQSNGIVGIKLHPPSQGTDLNDIRYKRLIEAISDAGMITVIHGGWDIGYTDHNYASVDMILEIIRDVAPERFVVAHMGGWASWPEVFSCLAGAPVWFDTAYSLGITPPRMDVPHDAALMYGQNLLAEQLVLMVRRHGADKVLFGTDSPWQDQKNYAGLLSSSGLTPSELSRIMGENAKTLLKSAGFPIEQLRDHSS